jgi:hypothetical protein
MLSSGSATKVYSYISKYSMSEASGDLREGDSAYFSLHLRFVVCPPSLERVPSRLWTLPIELVRCSHSVPSFVEHFSAQKAMSRTSLFVPVYCLVSWEIARGVPTQRYQLHCSPLLSQAVVVGRIFEVHQV